MSAYRIKERLVAALKNKGAGTLNLRNVFKDFDRDGNGTLSFDEFCAAFRSCGLVVRPLEMRALFLDCDKDGSGDISLDEFITTLRGKMSARRKAILANIFDNIDEDCDGVISMSDLGGSYQPRNHPDVLTGKKKTHDVLNEFFQNLNSVTSTGYVTFDQFVEYYENIGAFDDDSKFEKLMASLWKKHISDAHANDPTHHQSLRHLSEESSRGYAIQDTVDKYLPALQTLKAAIKSQGIYGLMNLTRSFRDIDDDMSKSLSLVEFKDALKNQYGRALTESHINQLFAHFDINQKGCVNYEDLLLSLRGEPTANRKKLISTAFTTLDAQGTGCIEPQEMISKYDCSRHPAVQAGKKNAESVLRELLDTFDVGGEVAGKVTRNEFESYYANLSCSIDDDHFFEQMMRNCWHIEEDTDDDTQLEAIKAFSETPRKSGEEIFSKYSHSAATPDVADDSKSSVYLSNITATEVDIATRGAKAPNSIDQSTTRRNSRIMSPAVQYLLGKLKAELIKRTDPLGFIALERKFKYSKEDTSREFIMSDFKKVAKSMGVSLSDHELRSLFEHFDYYKQGSVDYVEFMDALCDPLNDRRRQLIGIAFSLLDIDGSGAVSAEKVSARYEATRHPEVIAKRLSAHEASRQFLETFDVGGEIEGKVTRAEFENYYHKLGTSIINEDYFELLIRNVWRVSANENGYEKKWDGGNVHKKPLNFRHTKGGYHFNEKSQHQHVSLFDKPSQNLRKSNAMSLSTHASSPPKKLTVQTEFDSGHVIPKDVENIVSLLYVEAPPGIQYILRKLKTELNLRGIYGLIGLQRKFRLLDAHGRRTIDLNEFRQGLLECGVRLDNNESRSLFDHFDNKLSGTVSIDRVINAIRNPLNPVRKAVVNRTFTSIDKRDFGMITVQELLDAFVPSKHPDVIACKRSQQRVYEEFMETFDVGGTVEGNITRQEFENYYSNVSSFIMSDQEFESLMTGVWKNVAEEGPKPQSDDLYAGNHHRFEPLHDGHQASAKPGILPGTLATKYNLINQSQKKPPVPEPSLAVRRIISVIQSALAIRGIRGLLGLQRTLRSADTETTKILNLSDFKKCMRDARLELTDNELNTLFKYFDTDCVGTVEYEELIKTIQVPLSKRRKTLIDRTFDQLDKNGTGLLDAAFVADSYDANRHPDVVSRKKTAHDVFQDFLHTFDVGGEVEGKVTRNEFENYYANLSSTIRDEITFEHTVVHVWDRACNPSTPTPTPTPDIKPYESNTNSPKVSYQQEEKIPVPQILSNKADSMSTPLTILLANLKAELTNRGGMGYRALERAFRNIDIDGNKSLDMPEFDNGMKQIGLSLRKEELEILFNHFDVDGSGSIDFEEFMSGVRDSLSDHRLDLVEKCYEFLDNEGYGSIDADVLTRKYDYKNHPDVLDGKVKALDIYNDFLNSFDTNAEGTVTRTEFVNYYTNLVAGVGNKWNDAYFERLLRNTWNIPSDFLSDSTVDVYDTIARQTQFSLEPDKHRPAKTSIKHIRDHSNHSLLYHNNFGEQHGSYKLNLAQSKRQPSQEWNKSSLQLGAPNLAPTTTPTKHLSDFARKAEIARTPVAQRQSGNNSFRSQFTLG